jgi:hypothetical protein
MKKLIAAALVGLMASVGPFAASRVEAASASRTAGAWKYAGKYASYQAACKKAKKLEDCGYQTCIERENGGWCVYCR